MSESNRDLPNFALHCRMVENQPEANKKLINFLHNYICARIAILVGRDVNYIYNQIDQLQNTNRNFDTLPRLNKYLTNDSPNLFDMLDQNRFDNQDSESEGDFD